MTENAKNCDDHNNVPSKVADRGLDIPPTSHAGRMGTGNIASVASTSTDGAYQTAAHSTGYKDQSGSTDWLGGPQNGDEAYQTAAHSTGYKDQSGSADWLGGPQNGDEAPRESGSGNGGNG